MPRALTKEIVNARLKNRGIELIGEYINTKTNAEFKCLKLNHTWQDWPMTMLQQKGCPECNRLHPLTTEQVRERIAAHKNGVSLDGEYINAKTKIALKCVAGHKWKALPGDPLRGRGCMKCFRLDQGESAKKVVQKPKTKKPSKPKHRGVKKVRKPIVKVNFTMEAFNDHLETLDAIVALPFGSKMRKHNFEFLLCQHHYSMTPYNFMRLTGCPVCSEIKKAASS